MTHIRVERFDRRAVEAVYVDDGGSVSCIGAARRGSRPADDMCPDRLDQQGVDEEPGADERKGAADADARLRARRPRTTS